MLLSRTHACWLACTILLYCLMVGLVTCVPCLALLLRRQGSRLSRCPSPPAAQADFVVLSTCLPCQLPLLAQHAGPGERRCLPLILGQRLYLQGCAQQLPAYWCTVRPGRLVPADLVPGRPAEAYFGTPAELLHRSFNRPRDAQLSEQALTTGGNANQKLKR